jgi:hypothetical protein
MEIEILECKGSLRTQFWICEGELSGAAVFAVCVEDDLGNRRWG